MDARRAVDGDGDHGGDGAHACGRPWGFDAHLDAKYGQAAKTGSGDPDRRAGLSPDACVECSVWPERPALGFSLASG